MYEPIHNVSEKMRWLVCGIIAVPIVVFALSLLPVPATSSGASRPANYDTSLASSPNAVTSGLADASYSLGQGLQAAERSTGSSCRRLVASFASFGGSISRGLQSGARQVGHGLSAGAVFIGRNVSGDVAFAARVPGSLLGLVTGAPVVSAVITPVNASSVPVIGDALPGTASAQAVMPPLAAAGSTAAASPLAQNQNAQADQTPAWPIHGAITTLFGVPHWPYQPTHTGIDISDGQRPGVTPVRPFESGRVIDTISSNSGLGNHVIVDHGNGMTSVYGHLAAINVTKGQLVDKTTVLGLEGSTGASTGTHLHFEIRLNGQAVNPLQFVAGRP